MSRRARMARAPLARVAEAAHIRFCRIDSAFTEGASMILVAGATGLLGSEICRLLCEAGKPVRALVRQTSAPERVARLEQFGAEIARGDLKDRDSLDAACEGADVVISGATVITTAQPGDSFEATDAAGTISLVDAASQAGAKQFIFISFDTSRFPEAPLVNAKRAVETHLVQSGVPYTILHCSLFMEIWLSPMLFADPSAGTAKVYGRGTDGIRYVSAFDVAKIAVQCIGNPAARNATIPVGGPDRISQRDAVRIFEETFGKRFSTIAIPEQALDAQCAPAPDPSY